MSIYDELLAAEDRVNKYDALVQPDPSRLRANAAALAETDPEKVAQALRRLRGGMPETLAVSVPDAVIQAADRADQENRYDQILREQPGLAEWLENPATFAVARDDLESLGSLKRISRAFPAAVFGDFVTGVYGVGALVAENLAPDPRTNPKGYIVGHYLRRGAEISDQFAQVIAGPQDGAGPIEQGVVSGVRSVGLNLPYLVGGVLTRQPEVALVGMSGQTVGTEYLRAREEGLDPARAASYGIVQGGFEYITERIPALKLFGDMKAGTPFYRMLLNNLVREIPGEQAATLLQDFNSWVTLNPEKPMAAFAAERPDAAAQTLIATIVATGLQTGGIKGVDMIARRMAQAQDASDSGGVLNQLDTAADRSKLRERSPEKFEEVAEILLRESGRETVYMPVEAFETFYQSQNVDPAEAWQHLTGDAGGYAIARQTGVELQIPYAKYLARLSAEERKALSPYLRLSPDALNAVEAEAFGKDQDRIVGEALSAASDPGTDQAHETIYQDLLGQLLDRFPRDVAEKYAAAEAARFVAFNKAAGTDALADYQANAPRIVSEVPSVLRRVDFDVELDPLIERLRAGEVPTDREIRGPSLLEFLRSRGGIQDQGGELKALDAETADHGLRRVGERRLVNPEGLDLDAAREAAVEAGYLKPDDPNAPSESDVNALLEAIDRELRGTPVYAGVNENQAAADARAALNQLGEFVQQSGVDLTTASNDDIKRLLKTGGGPAEMQQQDQTTLEQPELRIGLSGYSEVALNALAADYSRRAAAAEGEDRQRWLDHEEAVRAEMEQRFDEQVQAQAAADGGAPRGRIRFTKPGAGPRQFEITLKGADLSTFLHEMGHYWLERMGDAAEHEGTPQQIKDDYAIVLKWMGVEGRDQIGTPEHEKFARANEAYLMEGKAPSARLRAVFARFRAWLLQVYERLARLNVSLTPEVRAVFDRLYATHGEIAEARAAQVLTPLWKTREESGMNDAEWAAYVDGFEGARVQAEEELAGEVLEPIRREEKDWWKAKRKAVTEEVTAQVNRRKDIVALQVLRTGKMPDGTEVDTPKLSKDALVADFGFTAESLAKLPRGIYSASGGASADALAPDFGYATGRELIEALAVVPNKQALIRESVEAELKRRYPDVIDDGSIGDKAIRAVHNDKAGELLVREAQILAERAAATRAKISGLRTYQLSRQMAKAAAQRVIEATPLKDLRPAKWKVAEAKTGNEAYRFAREGKLQQAAAAKQRQVLNHFLYREAVEALENADERVRRLRRLSTKEAREAIGKAGGMEYAARYRDGTEEVFESRRAAEAAVAEKGGFWFATNTYLEQIDRILERYDLRVRTARKLASRESLRQFVDRLNADGIAHEIPEEVIADARQLNYRELPVGFFAALSDAVTSIERVALKKSELIIAGQKRDRDEMAGEIWDSIIGNKPPRLPSIGDPTLPENILDYGNDALSLYLNADYMTREMDGGRAGAVTAAIYHPVNEAEAHTVNRKAQADKDLAEIFNRHYTPKQLRAMQSRRGANAIPMREVGETWNKFNVVALALNWGNEGNREAILRARYAGDRKLAQATVDRLLGLNGQPGLMTEADWAFVQDIWRYIDTFWPEIKAKQEQRKGVAPEKVLGAPLMTRFGQVDGGYFPLKSDSRHGGKAAQDALIDPFQDVLAGRYSSVQTKRGFAIERVGFGQRPVKLDIDVVFSHINEVITDLELGDAISSAWKLLEHGAVSRAFTEAGKAAYHAQLKLWLKDVARGQLVGNDAVSKPASRVRVNFTKAVLTFKVATALLQQTGHVQSLKILKQWWAVGMKQLLSRKWAGKNSVFEQIADQSAFMKARWDSATANAGVYDVMRKAKGDSRPGWMVRAGYWAMLHSQMLVDAPTWMGAYAQAIKANPDAKAAVRAADDAVKHAQGSGLFSDRSALERGTLSESKQQIEFVRMFTTLMSYMMSKGRLAYETTRNTNFKDPVQIARWTVSMVLMFSIEALLANLVRGGGPDDEDDDGLDAMDVLKWAGKETGLTMIGVIPFANMLGSELQGFRGGVPLTDAVKRIGQTVNQAEQGEMDKAMVRALSDTLGILTGFPSGQANVAIDAFWRDQEGEDVSPIEYLMRTKNPD